MTNPFLFGIEWELAVGGRERWPAKEERYRAGIELRNALRQLSPWLTDSCCEAGIFTPGFRYYIDINAHPEVATVEVRSPVEFVELREAIFTLLEKAIDRARSAFPGLVVLLNNRDYRTDATWGCHESYAIATPPATLAKGMLPFLATRPIVAGCGGFAPDGSFLFSPRALYLHRVTEGGTTSARALYSTARDEPHMGRGPFTHRLHLICGDAVRSQTSEYLKVATTALVLAWLQRDPAGAERFAVAEPLALLKEANLLARPDGSVQVSPKALSIQRGYLDAVADFVERSPRLPDWCPRAIDVWRQTLRLLETDPLSLSDRLDPFIKLALFRAAIADANLDWADVAKNPSLFAKLALLDLSYHTLGADSVFADLDRTGALAHRILANSVPLPDLSTLALRLSTRAAPRARLILDHSASPSLACTWTHICRHDPTQVVRFLDPTATELPVWDPSPEPAGPSDLLDLFARLRRAVAARR